MDEKQTREQLIDKQLKTVGWLKKYLKEEEKIIKVPRYIHCRNHSFFLHYMA